MIDVEKIRRDFPILGREVYGKPLVYFDNAATTRVYPEAARPLGGTPAQAERAIRHVIEVAWRRGDIEAQNELFGDTIDARRGRPTCGEMIAQLADILRWEG